MAPIFDDPFLVSGRRNYHAARARRKKLTFALLTGALVLAIALLGFVVVGPIVWLVVRWP